MYIYEYVGGCSLDWRDIVCTLGVFSTLGGRHEYVRGISQFIWGSSLIRTIYCILTEIRNEFLDLIG